VFVFEKDKTARFKAGNAKIAMELPTLAKRNENLFSGGC